MKNVESINISILFTICILKIIIIFIFSKLHLGIWSTQFNLQIDLEKLNTKHMSLKSFSVKGKRHSKEKEELLTLKIQLLLFNRNQ